MNWKVEAELFKNSLRKSALWNGSNPRTVISTELVTADGLAVDWVAKNLYWTDSGRKIIEVSRVDGSSRKILVDLDLDEPRAIVVFPRKGNNEYVCTLLIVNLHSVLSVIWCVALCDKSVYLFKESNIKTFNFALNTALAVSFWIWCLYQSVLYKNYIDTILLIPYVVVIQFAFKKLTPKKKITFERSQQIDFDTPEFSKIETSDKFTSTDDLKDYFLPTKDIVLTHVNEPMYNLNEYDLQNTISYIPEKNSISYVNNGLQLTSKPTPSIALSVKKHVDIYSADSEEDDTPRRKRFMIYLFWSDWGKPPKIERAYLDGTGRRVIVATDLGWPNGLTIDYEARRLYWVDAQLDRIETSDLSGKHRMQLVDDVAHPFGLTLFGLHLYWTDWHTKSIERVDKDTGRNRIVVRDNIEYLMEIKMVAASRQTGSNPCGEKNGGCSHLCLYKPDGRVCACPSYNDSRRCSTVPGDILLEPTKSSEVDEKVTVKEVSVPTTLPTDTSTRCSETDIENGRCEIIGYPPPDPVLQTAYIALSVILLIVVIVLTMALVCWKRNNKRRNEDLEGTLTFSNPTYSASSGDAMPSDRKVWPWKSQHRKKQVPFTLYLI
ncbi:low-density lipoprotein receptor-related protein 4 [Caerostris darwini]|uniref:Low-density lipoprotein receptor-related protein 4 n=1 Tax=Caerostris darwini TaxID=1538125 RepID=A0AAV4STR7_9ARAC|nr:low-density lipoprotein receptor-related protein 4 [Caerostris darwini]